ncbi:hypothetical protein O181_031384 [Austropuccinia psidii MF-1]|uniref:Uncharacterized protein n=1 Tax=Austropuccinia psidii MF-1 TaxID=1389203 RepID=A0A9Q3CUR7_9BASI|nr:hypothetical protein [Austropuccinia psidii MF-1]
MSSLARSPDQLSDLPLTLYNSQNLTNNDNSRLALEGKRDTESGDRTDSDGTEGSDTFGNLMKRCPREEELSDEDNLLDRQLILAHFTFNLPAPRRPRKAFTIASKVLKLTIEISDCYEILKQDIIEWQTRLRQYGLSTILKNAVIIIPWKLIMIFESVNPVGLGQSQKCLEAFQKLQALVSRNDLNSQAHCNPTLWNALSSASQLMDELVETLKTLLKLIDKFQGWHKTYVDRFLREHLIPSNSPPTQFMSFWDVQFNNSKIEHAIECSHNFGKVTLDLIDCLLFFLQSLKRGNRSLEFWKHLVLKAKFDHVQFLDWLIYWIEVLTSYHKALKNLKQIPNRFSFEL